MSDSERSTEEFMDAYKEGWRDCSKLCEKQIRDYEAALEFYSSAWRADIYTGPSEELLKDFGSMATEALAKWKR